MSDLLSRYDDAFSTVQNLTWLPWTGSSFPQRAADKKLLVVGESHYFWRAVTPEEILAERNKPKDPQETRSMVTEALVDREWSTPTLDAIPKLLFETREIDRARFWSDSAFYNFVQRHMHYKKGNPERPTGDDFVSGWKVFIEVVRILQPSHCLFIGVSAAYSFDDCMRTQNVSFVPAVWTQRISRTWGRKAKIEIDGKTTELCFVQHAGKYFSWKKWHVYLLTIHPELMIWLNAESYTTQTA